MHTTTTHHLRPGDRPTLRLAAKPTGPPDAHVAIGDPFGAAYLYAPDLTTLEEWCDELAHQIALARAGATVADLAAGPLPEPDRTAPAYPLAAIEQRRRARYLNPPPIPPETAEAAADEADEADRWSGAHPTHRGPFAGLPIETDPSLPPGAAYLRTPDGRIYPLPITEGPTR